MVTSQMQVEILEKTDAYTHVSLVGRLDTAGVDEVETRFNAAIVPSRNDAIVEVSGVEFLASMGIRMLLTVAKILNRSNARMILVAPSAVVEETLRFTGIADLIPVAADLEAAKGLLSRSEA